jgi:hypothetical protein
VEAYMMGVPAISYRAVVNEEYDYGFYVLPNKMSHQCFDVKQLIDLLRKVLAGEVGAADGDDRRELIKQYLAAQDGPLACERMIEVIKTISDKIETAGQVPPQKRAVRWALTRGLHLAKGIKSRLPGSHNRPEFQRHRYPGISQGALEAKLLQFQQLLGNNQNLKVEQISNVIFQISP